MKAVCEVCSHHCNLDVGQTGLCHARQNISGAVRCTNYGKLTALALDPIEKKPISMYMPGSKILSAGSYGCSLCCPFCQNWEISLAGMPVGIEKGGKTVQGFCGEAGRIPPVRFCSPQQLCDAAVSLKPRGNIGVAYTYNEPLVGWEYVLDTARLVHDAGMKNVLVSNGMAGLPVLERLLPYMDAMNIDLKSFSKDVYANVLGGDRDMVMRFIERAFCFRGKNSENSGDIRGGSVHVVHVEITALIVPGINDSEEEMRKLTAWIASLNGGKGRAIPLHITRYFPGYRMKRPPTDIKLLYRLAEAARDQLENVFVGNV